VFRRAFGWWFLAEDVCRQLTFPRTDVDATDRQFERLLLESSLWSFGDRIARNVRAGWLDSKLRSVTHTFVRDGKLSEPVPALQFLGCMMTIAAVTTLGAQTFVAGRLEPLGWAAPLIVAIGGVVLSRIASRIREVGSKKS
jgi:hypothetical protein